jgi:hypothetical protein
MEVLTVLSKGLLERDSDKKRPEDSVNSAESYARQTGIAHGIFGYGSATASWDLSAIRTPCPQPATHLELAGAG